MNTVADGATMPVTPPRLPRPSFLGAFGGEILKLRRQGWIWAMISLALVLFAVLSLGVLQVTHMRQTLAESPTLFTYNLIDIYLNVFDSGAGIVLLIVSARLVGMEYSGGTIRVLLSRGVGRLRLHLAKLAALALLGVVLLVGYAALVVATVYVSVVGWEGSAARLTSLPAHVWGDSLISIPIALASIGIAILVGSTAAVLGRSTTFGLAAALVLFPADNALTVVCSSIGKLTTQGMWAGLTTMLLGPSLNVLPQTMETDRRPHIAFEVPVSAVSAPHAWLVIAGWAAAMVVTCVVLLRRRDVLQ
jgi:ABC-type transport system involved in multi-copper enzyme maturation permease subunit